MRSSDLVVQFPGMFSSLLMPLGADIMHRSLFSTVTVTCSVPLRQEIDVLVQIKAFVSLLHVDCPR